MLVFETYFSKALFCSLDLKNWVPLNCAQIVIIGLCKEMTKTSLNLGADHLTSEGGGGGWLI